MSYDSYIDQRVSNYKKTLQEHQLLYSMITPEVAVWKVGKPDCLHCSIIATNQGELIVTGGVNIVQFKQAHYPPSLASLEWIAASNIAYVTEKAQIGMGDSTLVLEFSPQVAFDEANEMLRNAIVDEDNQSINMWTDVLGLLEQEDLDGVQELLGSDHGYFGMVPTERVILAWVLCQKAYTLLSRYLETYTLLSRYLENMEEFRASLPSEFILDH